MFLPSLFAMSIFMAMDLESFNRFFDVFVWIYLVAAIAVVVSFRKRQATSDSVATPEPVVYSLKKKVNTENMSWKQKFIGTWAKIERKNFYEFMLFNGAPSFVAYAQRDSDYGNIIEGKAGDENTIKISATGFPAAQGQFLPLTDKREGAPSFDSKDPAGNPVTAFLWWDEAEKLLRTEVKNPKKKMTTNMIRRIEDNDVLYLKVTNVKDEGGAECSFECTFKRTG